VFLSNISFFFWSHPQSILRIPSLRAKRSNPSLRSTVCLSCTGHCEDGIAGRSNPYLPTTNLTCFGPIYNRSYVHCQLRAKRSLLRHCVPRNDRCFEATLISHPDRLSDPSTPDCCCLLTPTSFSLILPLFVSLF
jgi:hypothetical protein